MFDTMGSGFRRDVIAVWNGEQFDVRDTFTVTTSITRDVDVNLPPEHPGYNNNLAHVATSWSIGAAYDPVRQSIVYGTLEMFLRPGGTPEADRDLQHELAQLSHRLYDVTQRVDRERRALKNAFAQCVNRVLNDDAISYILRFC
jgi:hypothetical protein